MNVCLKSGNIWSGERSQLPFKAEIIPYVFVLLCLIGVCLFLGDFARFFGFVKFNLDFSMCFYLVSPNSLEISLLFS